MDASFASMLKGRLQQCLVDNCACASLAPNRLRRSSVLCVASPLKPSPPSASIDEALVERCVATQRTRGFGIRSSRHLARGETKRAAYKAV
eukprot:757786-Prymnesium_polylepis.1